jgi:hypothetical protein
MCSVNNLDAIAPQPKRLARLDEPPRFGRVNDNEPIVALALLTERELERLGRNLERVYKINEDVEFADLMAQLDQIGWKPSD